MATLAGEFISTEGIVFGGSAEVCATSLLERKAQIDKLAKEEAALVQERDSLFSKRDEAKTALEIVSRLQRAIAAVPEVHFRHLRERLDARLGLGQSRER